jgi:hypothetical protein
MSFAHCWKAKCRCHTSASRRWRLGEATKAVAAVTDRDDSQRHEVCKWTRGRHPRARMPARSLPPIIFSQSRRRAGAVDHDGEWKTPLRLSSREAFPGQNRFAYSAASLSFFSGRTLRRTEAGFAANHLSSPVNGSLPKRFFLAGTSCATTFSNPGSVNSCAPFL